MDRDPIQEEIQRIQAYRERPAEWLIDVVGLDRGSLFWSTNPGYEDHEWDSEIQWPGQSEWKPCPNPLVAFLRAWARGYDQLALLSASGVGKTYVAAGAALWYIDMHRPSLVKTYAPSGDTLEDQLFGYMGDMLKGKGDAPGFKGIRPEVEKHNDLNVYIDPDSDSRDRWKISGETVESASGQQVDFDADFAAGAQGEHAEYMTIIIEEAPGVHQRIWNALETTATDPLNQLIAYGNPDSENDPLAEFADRESTLAIRLSGFDHPNYVCQSRIVPGAFGLNQPQKQAEKWGSRDHPMWKSRVRGIVPRVAGACLFKEKALESVEARHRIGNPEGKSLKDLPWEDPLFEIPHTPDRWRKALLRLAQSGGWGEDVVPEEKAEEVLEEELEESGEEEPEGRAAEEFFEERAHGIYDIEGYTQIYEVPKFDYVGRYLLALDVAGDYEGGDAHAGVVYDRKSRHVVAEIHMRGPREAYALAALALARVYVVPFERWTDREETIEKNGKRAWAADTYVDAEREVRETPTELDWPNRRKAYPTMVWETNSVGALHMVGPFKAYPNLYRERKRLGWRTTGGKTGSRNDMIEELRDWHHLLGWDPAAVPSEGLLKEMKAFKKNKNTGKYEAETGEHDDRVMALAIAVTATKHIPEMTETKSPDPPRRASPRSKPKEKEQQSLWDGATSGGVWTDGV